LGRELHGEAAGRITRCRRLTSTTLRQRKSLEREGALQCVSEVTQRSTVKRLTAMRLVLLTSDHIKAVLFTHRIRRDRRLQNVAASKICHISNEIVLRFWPLLGVEAGIVIGIFLGVSSALNLASGAQRRIRRTKTSGRESSTTGIHAVRPPDQAFARFTRGLGGRECLPNFVTIHARRLASSRPRDRGKSRFLPQGRHIAACADSAVSSKMGTAV